MPSTETQLEVPQVTAFAGALQSALDHAKIVKQTASIEPALTKADFEDFFAQLPAIFPNATSTPDQTPSSEVSEAKRARQYLVIETIVRDRFSTLVATTPIESPDFVEVWNIFDILAALSDSGDCDPALLFWLVEELLDSQTIEGCRTTFDFLESRRERITARHFEKKQLVILRSCNELLRRLSRAEDIAFCGRVFIFMFQSFPLGDKSSVNLRGEYHTENVTTYEKSPVNPLQAEDQMEVDSTADGKEGREKRSTGAKAVSFNGKDKASSEKPLDTDALYPVFWSLQQYFSQPTKLFDTANFAKFKNALEATVDAFESVAQGQKSSKSSDDAKDSSKKRKRSDLDVADTNNFNPKYLTSRDLFELEISDVSFRRHILIQAIIVLDFLRSLTSKAKAKYSSIGQPNKSVMYSDKLIGEDDDKWAEKMTWRIYEYIKAGPDGSYVHRIIQAVTSRDKGWTRWKMESCPPIARPTVSPAEFNEARASAKAMARNRRLRPHPMGSLSLDFLKEANEETALEEFKDPARSKLPELISYQAKIADDDFELGFAKSNQEKESIIEAKASKTWRALRIAGRTRLASFDKIDDWEHVDVIFQDPSEVKDDDDATGEEGTGRKPIDKRPVVISGPPGVGKSSLAALLLERQPGVFGKMIQHTTRKPKEGEVEGEDYHFVDASAYNMMLDGDQLLESTTKDGCDYGTNRRAAESISESGKVPLMRLDRDAVQNAKENGYEARVVFISPPSMEELEARIKKLGRIPNDQIPGVLKSAEEEVHQAKPGELYDAVVVNDELETAYQALEDFIYGPTLETNGADENGVTASEDVSMTDVGRVDVEASTMTTGN